MSKNVTIELEEPIEGHGPPITKLVYRSPVWRDVMAVGDAYTVHTSKDGERFLVENHEAIEHYAEVCLVEPKEYSLVQSQVGLADAQKVREAIMGFFLRAAQATAASKTSPKT
ncbi:hypothetical protein [Methylobacterium thuringiense]|uniref:Uncharacterized protein n=1 Tax=Methylobacterium thuringiense TaxID=1003091 RepID=A0ABQ4THW0_9HYPH|nr:hypothetical protein [Methylobacterium thuringiense]GJE54581.1 hypothetical protein EKPJFOCH_1059 [Methylobacterium thuringiense]